MTNWIDPCTAALAPLTALIQAHVMAAARTHGDHTTVPVLAKTFTGRLWTYMRDDQPFGGQTRLQPSSTTRATVGVSTRTGI